MHSIFLKKRRNFALEIMIKNKIYENIGMY